MKFLSSLWLVWVASLFFSAQAQHSGGSQGKVLLIAANPSVSQQTGWPIGAWAAEIVHPYWEFTEAGYQVDIVSPDGGAIVWDSYSDPEDPSRYSAHDLLSLGFKKSPEKMALLANTKPLAQVNPADYKALFVCGGQSPMYTFINNTALHKFVAGFYETGKPTAVICHGTCILLKTKLSNGKLLVEGKKWTGFANAEEQYADNFVGKKIQPFRIEDEARKLPNTQFQVGLPFSAFALQDGNLVTGQQQNSGTAAAQLVLAQLEKRKSQYPTYVLVHGAFANNMAWDAIRGALAKKANVISLDLPGHGMDYTPASQVSLASYVNAVKKLVAQQPGKVILVGHSMAGMIISQVAEDMPEKVSKLVYLSAYLPANGQSLQKLAESDKASLVGQNMEFAKDYTTVTIKKDKLAEAIAADLDAQTQEMLVKYHSPEPLKPFSEPVKLSAKRFGQVPKYYIRTTADKAVTPELQQQMIAANGAIKQVFSLNTSHLPFLAQPEALVQILEQVR